MDKLSNFRNSSAFHFVFWGLVLAILFLPWAFAAKPVAFGVLTFLALSALSALYNLPMSIRHRFSGAPDLDQQTVLEFMLRAGAFFIGGLFFLSGFVKLQDITGFSYKLDEYWGVFGTEFMKPTSLFLAWFVSVLEMALGFALITGWFMRLTSLLVLGMMVFFTFLTGYSAITGAVTDCGCFGDALKLTPMESFQKDIVLTAACLPMFILAGQIKPLYKGNIPLIATAGSFVVFGIISWYTYNHLPPLDFRTAYKVGQDLDYNWQNFGEDDQIIAHDFVPLGLTCDQKDFEGGTLYVIMYDLDKANKEAVKESVELAKALEGSGVKVIGGSASLSDVKEEFIKEYNIPYCIAGADFTVLKTMIRSNPGFMLMNEGIIKEKWHYNDLPSKEEVLGAMD